MNIALAAIGLLEWVAITVVTAITVIVIVIHRGRKIDTSLNTLRSILCTISILILSLILLVSAILWIAAFSYVEVQTGNTVDSIMINYLSCENSIALSQIHVTQHGSLQVMPSSFQLSSSLPWHWH